MDALRLTTYHLHFLCRAPQQTIHSAIYMEYKTVSTHSLLEMINEEPENGRDLMFRQFEFAGNLIIE